jgi:hypothetical protein
MEDVRVRVIKAGSLPFPLLWLFGVVQDVCQNGITALSIVVGFAGNLGSLWERSTKVPQR